MGKNSNTPTATELKNLRDILNKYSLQEIKAGVLQNTKQEKKQLWQHLGMRYNNFGVWSTTDKEPKPYTLIKKFLNTI